MKTYLYIAKLRMQTMLAYRMEVITYTVMQALIMLSVGFFWKAAYGGAEAAHGVTGDSMITYTVISALMGSLYYMGVEDRISDAVKTGSIATDMIKPINLFGMYFAEDMGNLVICFFQSALPIFIVALVIFGLPVPASLQHFLMFIPSFALGYGINWTFSALFAMIAFTAIDLGPAFSVKYHFVNMLSGALVPIWFFPAWLRTAVNCLPFVYMFQTPLGIYIGKYSISEGLQALGIQAIWFAVLAVIVVIAQKRIEKRVLVQGG